MKAFISVMLLLSSCPVFADYSLSDLVALGRQVGVPNKIARAEAQEASSERNADLWKLFPALNVTGFYLRNQYSASTPVIVEGQTRDLVVFPYEQYEAFARISMPLFDLEAINRFRASKAEATAAKHEADQIALRTDALVARSFFQFVGAQAMLESAQAQVASATNLVAIAAQKATAGTVSPLEADSATISLHRARQDLAKVQAIRGEALRALKRLTGINPEEAGLKTNLGAPLKDEGPIEDWMKELGDHPSIRAALSQRDAAERELSEARGRAFLPRISVFAIERYTNAYGLQGHPDSGQAGVILSWDFLDPSLWSTVGAKAANARAARGRAELARQEAIETIAASYDQALVAAASCQTARSQAELARKNLELANAQYSAAAISIGELMRSRQEAFAAQISLIQAEVEFLNARALLRIAAGRDLRHEAL